MKSKSVVTERPTGSAKARKNRARSSPRTAPEVSPPGQSSTYAKWAIAALAAAVVICYINTLWNGFVFDDHIHALENSNLRSLANLPRLLLSYRPLRDISYALDFAIWGESAAGFHFTNLAIHAANTILVFLLVKRLIRAASTSILTPTLAALIFALHPLQTDAVAYVSGRRDVLFTLFYLAAFHFYLTYRSSRSWKYLVLFLAAWALSLLSKEMAASFPLVIFTWSFCELWGESSGKQLRKFYESAKGAILTDRWLYLGLAVGGAAYTFYQTYTMGGSERAGYRGFRYWGGSIYHNVLTVIHVNGWYLKQLVWPTPITQYSGAFPVAGSIFDHMVIVSLAAVVILIGIGVFLLNKSPLLAFAIFSYFVMLLPVDQIIPHHELLADHYLYLPIFSFGLFVALIIERLAGVRTWMRAPAWAAAAAIVVIFGIMTVRQNGVWRDDYSLWQANYEAVPNSPRAAYSLGVEYISKNPRKAADLFRRCIALDPGFAGPYTDLVMLSKSKDEARDAEGLIQQGLALPDSQLYNDEGQNPRSFRSHLTTALALARDDQGDHAGAEKLLWKAIALSPGNIEPYDLLGGRYQKDPAKLQEVLTRELKAAPYSNLALQRMCVLLLKDKKYDEAMPYLRRMLSVNPNDSFANFQLSQIYRTDQDCAHAWYYMKLAQASAKSEDAADLDKAARQMEKECGPQ